MNDVSGARAETWRRTLIAPAATLIEALQTLASEQICLVADDKGCLLGTVTDGDVRRGLLRLLPLDATVVEVMNREPHCGAPSDDPASMRAQLRALKLRHMPIVDSSRRITGLIRVDGLTDQAELPNSVVLVAGGMGSRLMPLTENMPKPLLKVGGKPIIDSIIERFAEQGFRKFFLSINYKAEMFQEHCRDGSKWGVSLSYIREDRPLGTAGPLGLIGDAPTDPILVMNADVLTKVDFRQLLAFHADHKAVATMGVRQYGLQVPYGVVRMHDTQIVDISEKPAHVFFVNAGIYVLERAALERVPRGEPLDMPDLFKRLIGDGLPTAAYPVCEYWIDVGRHDDLARADSEFEEIFG